MHCCCLERGASFAALLAADPDDAEAAVAAAGVEAEGALSAVDDFLLSLMTGWAASSAIALKDGCGRRSRISEFTKMRPQHSDRVRHIAR